MSTFTVHLTHVVSTSRTVEAEDYSAAMDAAQESEDLPTPGFMVGDEYDPAGEWEVFSVSTEDGDEVWSQDAEDAAEQRAHSAIVERAVEANRALTAKVTAFLTAFHADGEFDDSTPDAVRTALDELRRAVTS